MGGAGGGLVFLEDLLDGNKKAFFVIAVVSLPADVQRNLSLIKEKEAMIDGKMLLPNNSPNKGLECFH